MNETEATIKELNKICHAKWRSNQNMMWDVGTHERKLTVHMLRGSFYHLLDSLEPFGGFELLEKLAEHSNIAVKLAEPTE